VIARLTGRILEREPQGVVIDVGGLGYGVRIPLSTFYALPEVGEAATLRIHTHLTQDSLTLYGFASRQEQSLFERLIEISGVGPRLALTMLSGLPTGDLVDAIGEGDAARLRGIPGVGPKTADRVVLEMRDKVSLIRRVSTTAGAGAGPAGSLRGDVISALVNLGYREGKAEEAVRKALAAPRDGGGSRDQGGARLQEVLKRSLKYLAS
jgi:Holliday junction DNA helicase RuvA